MGLSISGGFAILMLLLGVLAYIFWKKNKKYQKESNTSSFELLNCSSSLPPMRRDLSDLSSINPVPKPPRTGQYGDSFSRMSVATAHGDDDDSKLRLTWQDELNCNYVSTVQSLHDVLPARAERQQQVLRVLAGQQTRQQGQHRDHVHHDLLPV